MTPAASLRRYRLTAFLSGRVSLGLGGAAGLVRRRGPQRGESHRRYGGLARRPRSVRRIVNRRIGRASNHYRIAGMMSHIAAAPTTSMATKTMTKSGVREERLGTGAIDHRRARCERPRLCLPRRQRARVINRRCAAYSTCVDRALDFGKEPVFGLEPCLCDGPSPLEAQQVWMWNVQGFRNRPVWVPVEQVRRRARAVAGHGR
jgi:hypothetical protein